MSGPLVAVLDYGIGNLRSAQKALESVGADARLTDDPDVVSQADGVVLPGVGAVGRWVGALEATGLAEVAADAPRAAVAGGRPVHGLC
ncbi:MAG: imidazole glycerol phosphate synthase subunit HisH, partial [Actinomycetota bacterium]|nr:imidazole glycerol phosphate synthase subunit HisH [Actinomycetota bacterium]MEC8970710.1 imidazole glycerol phosphate synthase subunit HisH [Actinomycetota bacterium]